MDSKSKVTGETQCRSMPEALATTNDATLCACRGAGLPACMGCVKIFNFFVKNASAKINHFSKIFLRGKE